MTKVVINTCFGGFGLSVKATEDYLGRKGLPCYWFTDVRDADMRLESGPDGRPTWRKIPVENPEKELIAYSYTSPEPNDESYFYSRDIERDDPDLVAVVEELGDVADGEHARLKVIAIPDDVDWRVTEYDGLEHIAEEHRVWS